MTRRIKKVAIVGSGIMGSGIACHFANIGVEVLLLDIIPRELNDKEKAKIEKNRIKFGVFKFTTKKVPAITPKTIKTPNDLTILKSTQ